jgi:antitoxin (DNA-binding transcriptional repressor) of toxin-antitoxin stability system
MKATVVDLRYKTRELMEALDRRETVTLTYRGKVKGYLVPAKPSKMRVQDHPFFGSDPGDGRTVAEEMRDLRAGRYDDL